MCPARFAERLERSGVDTASERSEQATAAGTLVVGAADDRAEVEADRVAHEVIARLQAADAGPEHAHTEDCGHDGVRRAPAPAGGAEVGLEGGALSEDLSTRIESRRGGGSALPTGVRRRLEGGFGGSLADVRVHADAESADLNRAVSARAFTTGNDIFFGAGEYRPDSPEGETVLAHEIAHTRKQAAGARRLHRFSLANTDFTKTKTVSVFQKGGSGRVALFDDDSGNPLVVKVDQLIGNEVAVAGKLHGATAAESGGSGGFSVSTPGVRLAAPQERVVIKQQTLAKLDPTQDPRNFVTGLDSTKPVVIMEQGAGKDFSEVIAQTKHTKKGMFGKTVANNDSILFKLVKEPGPITALAQQLPVDVVMGMHDRLIGYYNPDNFMYDSDTQTFGFVDNTQNIARGFLTTVDVGVIQTSKEAFDAWAVDHDTQNLAKAPATLAKAMFDTTFGEAKGNDGLRNLLPNQKGLHDLFESALTKNQAKIMGWIEAGILKGRASVISQLQNPLPLVSSLADVQKAEALQSLLARNLVLKGAPPDKAWQSAGVHAGRLLPPRPAPKQKPVPPPKPAKAKAPSTSATKQKPVPPPKPAHLVKQKPVPPPKPAHLVKATTV